MTDHSFNPEVLLVSLYYDKSIYSGANKRFDETGKFLMRNGIGTGVVVMMGHVPAWCPPEQTFEIDTGAPGPLRRLEQFYRLGSLLDRLPSCIVISDFMPVPARSLRRHIHIQLVHDLRNFTEFHRAKLPFISRKWQSRQWNKAGKILTVSRFTGEQLEHHCGIPSSRIIISHNGIEPDYLEKKMSGERTIDLLYVAHFEKRKNYLKLIRALEILKGRGVTPRTVLVGRDKDEGVLPKVQNLIRKGGLSENVEIHGQSFTEQDLIDLYLDSNVFVTPARYEGFGMPIIEAMASGCLVSCSDIGVFHEVAGPHAVFFDPENELDIADALENALGTEVDRNALRSYVSQYFTWDRTLHPILDMVSDTMKAKKSDPFIK